jgi:hypothetical protein
MRRPLRPALVKASQDRRQKKKIEKSRKWTENVATGCPTAAGVEVGEAGSTSVS